MNNVNYMYLQKNPISLYGTPIFVWCFILCYIYRIFVLKQSYCKIRLSWQKICFELIIWGGYRAYGSEVGPVLSVDASDIGWGLVAHSGVRSIGRTGKAGKSGIWAWIHQGYTIDTAGIDREWVRSYESDGLNFYQTIPDQAIKSDRHWSGVSLFSGVKVALVSYFKTFKKETDR